MIKVDLYTSNVCSRCVSAKELLHSMINDLGVENFDLHFIDVVENIDDAVALGILATPSIVINNRLVFPSLPHEKKLKIVLESYL